MAKKSSFRIANVCLLLAAAAFSLWLVAARVPASDVRNGLLAGNWALWAAFVVSYPFAVLSAGEVSGTNAISRSSRDAEPARFWMGLVAITAFWLAVFLYISLLSYMAWYRGA